ncbi:Gluconate 5-dehydrogenase [Oligella sp. MSHR50489EDL]|uniref:SDR family oxidoreductase n=1 Tax=Oligella sp. MSHR50489EDL TaxID=3139409 RepID=UPI003D81A21F
MPEIRSSFLNNFKLNNKIALITGSSSGLGLVMAMAMARSGAEVIINGRNEATLIALRREAAKQGLEINYLCADLSDFNAIDKAIREIKSNYGKCDILINNIGTRIRKSLQDFNQDEILTLVQQNLTAAIYLSQQIAELMIEQQWGRIITISSIAGRLARAGDSVYPVTKMGLEGLVRSLAVQYAAFGITSNGIAPGFFATQRNLSMMRTEEEKASHVLRVPMKRWGEPEELAGAAVFFASEAASYINGQILTIDGGFTASF